jgi:hypothetical protein
MDLTEKKEDKGRGLWKLGVLPSAGRKCSSSGGSNIGRWISRKYLDRWKVFTSRKASGEAHRRGDCGPSDVHIESRQLLDRPEGAWCLNHRK